MINSYDKSLMEKLCRSCMCESTDVRNLFDNKNAIGDQSHLIADMFMACAAVEVKHKHRICLFIQFTSFLF